MSESHALTSKAASRWRRGRFKASEPSEWIARTGAAEVEAKKNSPEMAHSHHDRGLEGGNFNCETYRSSEDGDVPNRKVYFLGCLPEMEDLHSYRPIDVFESSAELNPP